MLVLFLPLLNCSRVSSKDNATACLRPFQTSLLDDA
jgi:hypothetical protein